MNCKNCLGNGGFYGMSCAVCGGAGRVGACLACGGTGGCFNGVCHLCSGTGAKDVVAPECMVCPTCLGLGVNAFGDCIICRKTGILPHHNLGPSPDFHLLAKPFDVLRQSVHLIETPEHCRAAIGKTVAAYKLPYNVVRYLLAIALREDCDNCAGASDRGLKPHIARGDLPSMVRLGNRVIGTADHQALRNYVASVATAGMKPKDASMTFKPFEIKAVSLVSVPSNPDAVVTGIASGNGADQPLGTIGPHLLTARARFRALRQWCKENARPLKTRCAEYYVMAGEGEISWQRAHDYLAHDIEAFKNKQALTQHLPTLTPLRPNKGAAKPIDERGERTFRFE